MSLTVLTDDELRDRFVFELLEHHSLTRRGVPGANDRSVEHCAAEAHRRGLKHLRNQCVRLAEAELRRRDEQNRRGLDEAIEASKVVPE